MSYAKGTAVDIGRSEGELKSTLRRYGADQIVIGEDTEQLIIIIRFRFARRHYQIIIPIPNPDSPEFTLTPERRSQRTSAAAQQAWEAEYRRKWRAANLYVKATLEAVESGIVKFEEAFLGATLLRDGSTVNQTFQHQIAAHYQNGEMPKLLN